MNSLGEVFRSARKTKGLSQAAVGAWIGKRQQTIGNYERDRRVPNMLDLGVLARNLELEVPDDELVRLVRLARQKRNIAVHQAETRGMTTVESELSHIRVMCLMLVEWVQDLAQAVETIRDERASS